MSQIVEPKTYTGKELETIFFRPMLTGPDAKDLGIKVMYNMPVPTTLNFWRGGNDILQKYSSGWSGGAASEKFQKNVKSKPKWDTARRTTSQWCSNRSPHDPK